MLRTRLNRALALITAAAVLATMTAATVANPVSAAKPQCQGLKATIVGTRKSETIRGTAKRDIIVAKGGADRIFGRGGNDVICAGGGNDFVVGGLGVDRLWGQLGRDRLYGGPGPDFLAGQVGNDTLNGGIGVDTCFQGTGSGPVVRCERPAPPPSPPPPAPPPKVFAVAYSDLDGAPGPTAGDILISELVDTNQNGVVDHGDTIVMGKYPTSLTPTAADFVDWGVKSHIVKTAEELSGNRAVVRTLADDVFTWSYHPGWEAFEEKRGSVFSTIQDGRNGIAQDVIFMQPTSPSTPVSGHSPEPVNTTDDRLVDVTLDY